MIIVAFDVGKFGGVCRMIHGLPTVLIPMPVTKTGKGSKTEYDEREIRRLMLGADLVVIERQQAFSGQGVTSTGSLMQGYGLLRGIAVGLDLAYTLVGPRTWQKEMYEGVTGEGKTRSFIAAQRLYPQQSLLATPRCKKPHDGVADALLIAAWATRALIPATVKWGGKE